MDADRAFGLMLNEPDQRGELLFFELMVERRDKAQRERILQQQAAMGIGIGDGALVGLALIPPDVDRFIDSTFAIQCRGRFASLALLLGLWRRFTVSDAVEKMLAF